MKKLKMQFLLLVLFSLAITAACSNQSAGSSGGEQTVKDEPVGKYESPVTVTMAFPEQNNTTFPEGDSLEDNIWTRALEEEYGITVDYSWVTHTSEYTDKLNISIASGELPDIFQVNPTQYKELAEAGMIADLTEIYEKHISELADEKMTDDGGIGMEMAKLDGKLMGLPYITAATDGATMIWIRKDWLENVGLNEPKSMDDVIAIAEAFKNDDPDQNGKDDTLGLGVVSNIFAGGGGLQGFFNGFHAYTDFWVEDKESDGLVNGLVQPEMKEALSTLQEMYKEGIIDPEFTTKTGIGEDVIAGKMGMFFGTMSQPLNPLQQTMDNDPNAEWQYYPIQSVDEDPAKPQIISSPPNYYVVNKNAENPAAIVKMMNLWVEKMFGETAEYDYHYQDEHNSHKYHLVRTYGSRKNLDAHLKIKEVLESGNVDDLDPEQKGYYDEIQNYMSGDPASWKYDKIFGIEGSQSQVNKYLEADLLLQNQYQGLPTDLMVEKGGILSSLASETFTKIIMGDPIDSFDDFVNEWNELGGEEITKEVNDWYNDNK